MSVRVMRNHPLVGQVLLRQRASLLSAIPNCKIFKAVFHLPASLHVISLWGRGGGDGRPMGRLRQEFVFFMFFFFLFEVAVMMKLVGQGEWLVSLGLSVRLETCDSSRLVFLSDWRRLNVGYCWRRGGGNRFICCCWLRCAMQPRGVRIICFCVHCVLTDLWGGWN